MLDECILLEIYPAREKPIEGITSGMLVNKMTGSDKKVMSKEEVLQHLEKQKPEVLLTMGAGDIDSLIGPIEKILNKN
jgi:UDP-N-acetylmuramate--alanine ligase